MYKDQLRTLTVNKGAIKGTTFKIGLNAKKESGKKGLSSRFTVLGKIKLFPLSFYC